MLLCALSASAANPFPNLPFYFKLCSMFDAERLLGGLIKRKVRRKSPRMVRKLMRPGVGTGTTAVLGMGAIGLAFAAFEHFSQKKASGPPPPPGPAGPPRVSSGPPPPPGMSGAAPPPPPPVPTAPASEQTRQKNALLLIRAMIAAAHADGQLDEKERSSILSQVEEAGLGEEERRFMLQELDHPSRMDSLLPAGLTPGLREQVYAASLLAIEVDSQAERDYLDRLAQRLGLDEAARKKIEAQFV